MNYISELLEIKGLIDLIDEIVYTDTITGFKTFGNGSEDEISDSVVDIWASHGYNLTPEDHNLLCLYVELRYL